MPSRSRRHTPRRSRRAAHRFRSQIPNVDLQRELAKGKELLKLLEVEQNALTEIKRLTDEIIANGASSAHFAQLRQLDSQVQTNAPVKETIARYISLMEETRKLNAWLARC